MDKETPICAICGARGVLLDVVDLNKSCEGARGKFLELAGIPVYYAMCRACGFCWCPELHDWPLTKFEEYIYNDDYVLVDPDYLETRPKANAGMLRSTFPNLPSDVRHLDYGGGNGLLSKLLRESNWDSRSYDPFVDKTVRLEELGKFDFITAFEVFEHVPNVQRLLSDLNALLSNDGLLLFSTLLSDGNIQPNQRLSWWYASPRNGHISLFSRNALFRLGQSGNFKFGSFSAGLHVFFRAIPTWANHLARSS